MKLSEELERRGFVHQFVGESLAAVIDEEKRVVYHGIDPTADSAHVGNFVSWLLLRHLVQAGHQIIFLVGGGTGMIGDPKPDVERTLLTPEQVAANVAGLQTQAERIFGEYPVTFVNNAEWLQNLQLIEFLRDIGKHFTVNELVKKDAIASRLSREDGISYTEFAYPLLQAFDYLELHRRYGCDLQVSGSDQWGNIVAGVDLIRRKENVKVFALTSPMIIDKTTGKKFGKSEGNAVWLDPNKTSPYAFYQFWLNVADENVIDYLKIFTFLNLEEITELEQTHLADPGSRIAQQALARAVTTIVHGEARVTAAEEVTNVLFGDGDIAQLGQNEITTLKANAPTCLVAANTELVEVLVEAGLATSKREARLFIESGAISIAGEKVSDTTYRVSDDVFVSGLALLRRGKKNVTVLLQA
jgi:tyrosyl-tRNA synthetase